MAKSVVCVQLKKTDDTQRIGKRRSRILERQRKKQRHKIIIYLAIVLTICAVLLSFKVIPYVSDLVLLKQEQSQLNAHYTQMQSINPDYVGLLKIDGTTIDFPVVQGSDNEKYLHTTFGGEENIVGAIFMDYRCVGDYVPNIIIYGHEVSDLNGNKLMFGGLRDFLDEQYLAEHSKITFTENDRISEFEIFSARITDINDPAYYLDFNYPGSFRSFADRNGAPTNAEQIITLATCFGANNGRRMIVQGVLKYIEAIK